MVPGTSNSCGELLQKLMPGRGLSARWHFCLLMCRMNNDPLSPILDQLYPGARVHHGFLDQFQAVTDQAANTTENIRHAPSPSMFEPHGASLWSCTRETLRVSLTEHPCMVASMRGGYSATLGRGIWYCISSMAH